ncbi:hypothetical protein A9255_05475 [Xenorhabdus hominickii]|uniref:Uncharacterized protein n=1 Tax=Xenorhabdus hominickii TaxID=351679 RepID=A0A2G0Q4Z3_XENHO|nr:hypothetical protein A9255_05475 [Xenorhabdus hominickii]PHM54293.1 hypothetical protein Xhom_03370 [Xenorhabdus hominickii]
MGAIYSHSDRTALGLQFLNSYNGYFDSFHRQHKPLQSQPEYHKNIARFAQSKRDYLFSRQRYIQVFGEQEGAFYRLLILAFIKSFFYLKSIRYLSFPLIGVCMLLIWHLDLVLFLSL